MPSGGPSPGCNVPSRPLSTRTSYPPRIPTVWHAEERRTKDEGACAHTHRHVDADTDVERERRTAHRARYGVVVLLLRCSSL